MSKTKKMVIRAKDIKVSIGHRQHTTGTGVHDSRPKRRRTRSANNRAAIKEWS